MNQYLAVIDDQHDVKDPITVIQVVPGAGPYGVTRLNEDAAWVVTRLLDQISAGEVPYRVESITPKTAARIRNRRERGIDFRYSILVQDDDPTDRPVGVLREWDASRGGGTYAETFSSSNVWEHSSVRLDIERGSDISTRIVPSDSATVHRFIEAVQRR
ncbi:hypothetical protein Q0Z83_092380 [Actinoplanes sichuanensis]|uniref:Uncharacterized protein n=1 Tax=Actinoplanes sichuanensis TaxID=512349 RepID=A0ABW4AM18_9ACTN|nr:hypothetical protein [Actinoplanes sichuanensis]BEL11047.1 hypothetical protein Q0Z83_092380 [Actinoplanes sichuanensis]